MTSKRIKEMFPSASLPRCSDPEGRSPGWRKMLRAPYPASVLERGIYPRTVTTHHGPGRQGEIWSLLSAPGRFGRDKPQHPELRGRKEMYGEKRSCKDPVSSVGGQPASDQVWRSHFQPPSDMQAQDFPRRSVSLRSYPVPMPAPRCCLSPLLGRRGAAKCLWPHSKAWGH